MTPNPLPINPSAPSPVTPGSSFKYPITIRRHGRTSMKVQVMDNAGDVVCVVEGAGPVTPRFIFSAETQPAAWRWKGSLGKTHKVIDEADNVLGQIKEVGYRTHKRHIVVLDRDDNTIAEFEPHGARAPSAAAVLLGGPMLSLLGSRNAESMTGLVGGQEMFVITGRFPEFTLTALAEVVLPQQAERLVLMGAVAMTGLASQI